MKKVVVVLSCMVSLFVAGILHAENIRMDEIVVTATRSEEQRQNIPASVTIITKEDIEKRHVSSIPELLRIATGIDVAQPGGTGKTASIFIRGAESRHTLVLIDGVRVNSPTTGGFDFADLSVDNIERIEIIPGALSTLYGSDAIGGVIQIFTKKGAVSAGAVSLEGGSYGTTRETVSAEIKRDRYDLSLAASRRDTEGFSAVKSGTERDGYQNTTISSRIGIERGANSRVDITARLTEAKTEIDGWNTDDPNYQQQRRWSVVGMDLSSQITNNWGHKLSLSRSSDRLTGIDEDTVWNRFLINTDITTVDWQQNIRGSEGNLITLGYEWQQKKGEVKGAYNKSFSNHAAYLQEQRALGASAQLLAGIRWDDSSIYDSAFTYNLGVSYLPVESVKWHARYGTGFKGPNLNDLFWPGAGNPDLKPEKSQGWEIGVEEILSENLSLSLAYYDNLFNDLIQWICDPSFVCQPQNRAKTRSNGIETNILWHPSRVIHIDGNYTYNDTDDSESNFYLQRRPLNKYTITLSIKPSDRVRFVTTVMHVGKRVEWADNDFDGTPDQQNSLSAYSKVDLLASYKVRGTAEIYARIENLFDVEYEEAEGYSTAGFSSYGGLRVSF